MSRSFILIPAHNRREFTLGCLTALRANGDLTDHTAIVVDDGSTDGTGEAVRAAFPDVVVLQGNGRLFWTGAIALAMREAAVRNAGVLFWLNDDCRPRPGALRMLHEYLADRPHALAGPQCLDATTGAIVATGFSGRRTFPGMPGAPKAVQGLSGFCVGLGAGVASRLGPPDASNFPHYYGDNAYTLRASRAGCSVVLFGDATVELLDHHEESGALDERFRTEETLSENWRRILLAANSPHRLRTLFAFQRLKYGVGAGSLLAAIRATGWITRLLFARIFR